MAIKPTAPVDWAESGVATDPADKRATGWLTKDQLPAANANFLWQALGRWVTFLGAQFGNSGELTQDVAGGALVATTGVGYRDVSHTATGMAALLGAHTLRARDRLTVGQSSPTDTEGASWTYSGTPDAPVIEAVAATSNAAAIVDACAFRPQTWTAASADQRAEAPPQQALWREGVVKLAGRMRIQFDGSGSVDTVSLEAGSLNVSAVNFDATPDWFTATMGSAFTPGSVQITPMSVIGLGSQIFTAMLIGGAINSITIALHVWSGSGWTQVGSTGIAGLANGVLDLHITAT